MKENQIFKVFIVDDDAVYLTALEKIISELSKSNVKVYKFLNAKDLLNELHQNPGLIILDYYLSKDQKAENGLQVLRKIKRKNEQAKVIMLSSQDQLAVAVNSIKFGAYDYLVKNESAFVKIQNSLNNALQLDRISHKMMFQKKILRIMSAAVFGLIVAVITYSFYY
jgi:two-component system OmpR family response regulator